MRTVLSTGPATEYRCPTCRSIDWFRDGCVIAENDAAIELRCGRVQHSDPSLAATSWSCNQCGHEVPPGSRLAAALDGIRHETCDQPEG
jgi:hypothetical protein